MSEPIDPNVNFNAALRAARLRQQGAAPDPEPQRDDLGEPVEAEGQGSRRPITEQIAEERGQQPRDPDTGQFVPRNDPLARFGPQPPGPDLLPAVDPGTIDPPDDDDQDDDQLPPAAEQQQQEEQQLLAGRFRTPEELEQAYQNLERQQGASSQEMHELRSTVDALTRRVLEGTAPSPAPQQLAPLTEEQLQIGLARSGREYLATLYEQEHPSYDDALDVALATNPRLAMQWSSEVAAWEAEQRLRAELAPLGQQLEQVTRTSAAGANSAAWNAAWRELAGQNPELNVLAEKMLQDLQQNQWLAAPVKEGVPQAEKLVIENLLRRARDAHRPLVDEARRAQAEQIGQEKTAATVATASGTSAPVAGESGQSDESSDRVKRLKSGILANVQGQSVHEAIHGAQTR